MTQVETMTAYGEDFIRQWYRKIDGKAPFEKIERLTVGEALVVDFPNNPLDLQGFRSWYNAQCRDFTGTHEIHSIRVSRVDDGTLVIFSEITWNALDSAGKTITMRPNVTLKLDPVSRKVYYYGCVDRVGAGDAPGGLGKEVT